VKRDGDGLHPLTAGERSISYSVCEAIRDHFAQHFGGRVRTTEFRVFVKVAIRERTRDLGESDRRTPNVNDDSIGVELSRREGGVDNERGAVESLRRPEGFTREAVGDHHVVPNRYRESHSGSPQ
jgi:hypothetical protein